MANGNRLSSADLVKRFNEGATSVAPKASGKRMSAKDLVSKFNAGGFTDAPSPDQPQQVATDAPSGGPLLPPPEQPIQTGATGATIPAAARIARQPGGFPERPGPLDPLTGESRLTPETRELPELLEVSVGGLLPAKEDIGQAVVMLTASDEDERMDMLKEVIPGIQFEKDEKGVNIATLPDGRRAVVNRPGFSDTDAMAIIAEIGKFAPAARLSSLGRGILQKLGLGAATAAGTQATTETASTALGGEVDAGEIALAGGLGAVGESIGPLASKIRNALRARRAGVAISELDVAAPQIARGAEAAAETGIPLSRGQKTLIPSQLEEQAFVGVLPAGIQDSIAFLSTQNREASRAVSNFIRTIAPDLAVDAAAFDTRTAAQKAISLAKARRREFARFGEAVAEADAASAGRNVDLKAFRDSLDDVIKDSAKGGEVESVFKKVKGFLTPRTGRRGKAAAFMTFRQLQNAKKEMDGILDNVTDQQVSKGVKVAVREVREELLNAMDEASPDFKEARQRFASVSDSVTELEKGIIGRISKLDDTQLKQVRSSLFDANQNAKVTRTARKAIEAADPDAWRAIVRSEFEDRLGRIPPDTFELAAETIENVPGRLFRALFPNQSKSDALMAGLNPEQTKNLNYIKEALRRASKGRPGGSQTAAREEIKKRIQGGPLSWFGNLFNPANTASESLKNFTFDKRTKALAEAIFDPEWKPRMEKIRKIDMQTPAAGKAMVQLLDDIEAQQSQSEETN